MLVKKVPEFSPPPELLEGKNILITGAGSGIGRQLAIDFAQKGANLILMSKDFKKLMSVQDQIKGKNNKEPLIIEFDFLKAKDKEYKRLSEGIDKHISCLDGLVHVAAVLGYISPFMSTSLGQLKTVMEVNFESNFFLSKAENLSQIVLLFSFIYYIFLTDIISGAYKTHIFLTLKISTQIIAGF